MSALERMRNVVAQNQRTSEQTRLDVQSEEELSLHLRELHLGDPAYEGLTSPRRIRAQEARDRENDRP